MGCDFVWIVLGVQLEASLLRHWNVCLAAPSWQMWPWWVPLITRHMITPCCTTQLSSALILGSEQLQLHQTSVPTDKGHLIKCECGMLAVGRPGPGAWYHGTPLSHHWLALYWLYCEMSVLCRVMLAHHHHKVILQFLCCFICDWLSFLSIVTWKCVHRCAYDVVWPSSHIWTLDSEN